MTNMIFFGIIAVLIGTTYPTTGYNIGAPCTYDDDCEINHAFCKSQRTCMCKEGYRADPSNQNCLAMVGAKCYTSGDCSSLPNSYCKDVCVCNSGYVADITSSQCLPVVTTYGSDCKIDEQCKPTFGNSQCTKNSGPTGKCLCYQQYHPDPSTQWCLQDRGLNDQCSNSSNCYIDEYTKSKLECRNNQCKCRSGLVQTSGGRNCTNDAINIFPKSSIFAFTIILTLHRLEWGSMALPLET